VKTNVLFFTKGSPTDKLQDENCTQNVWVYDLRTNMPSFGKRTPFGEQHLKPFEQVYGSDANGQSERTEGEYSFNAEKIDVDKTSIVENQDIDERLVHSRWRKFTRQFIETTKGDSLDISWLKDKDSIDATDLPEPTVLAIEAKKELTFAIAEINKLMAALGEAD
jgi:type I restriction enzyme M protein